ncbi:MAG TPA: carboxypeptidase regulatory-like domain-containing protein [Bryobacteraceae bacterium]|nr:carboxypeptidase regulatory-like domain-containing protein [Bryobacteraceae bacterium]
MYFLRHIHLLGLLAGLLALPFEVLGQAPTGSVSGTVKDQSGAVIVGVTVTITNKATAATRNLTSNTEGLYSAPALLPGDYEIRAEMQGFRTVVQTLQVVAGGNTTADIAMSLGTTQEVVNVEATAAQVNLESQAVAGVVARNSIQELPINGRSFMSLAALEPGVSTAPGTAAQFNSLISVTTLGGVGYTRFTIDGGIVNDQWEGTGTADMNFSQEIIQEFQISTVNFDVTAGVGTSGQVNVVTRSGSNDFHGSGYFFFRDHNMAAYPGLKRDPKNPDPFFARRNPGIWVGGPILKNKLFFFTNYEYMNQDQVYPINEDLPSLRGLSGAPISPYHNNLFTTRFDYTISTKHTLFARYSHDSNLGFGPYGGSQPLQSGWSSNANWSDQSMIGFTSAFTSNFVNDARIQYHFWQNIADVAAASQCPAPCPGFGLPSLVVGGTGAGMVGSSTFYGGVNDNSPQPRQARTYEIVDNVSWQKGAHRIRFGADIERYVGKDLYQTCELSCLGVYSPETTIATSNPALLAQYMPNLPRLISGTADILQLPVFNTSTSLYSGVKVGYGYFPGLYERDKFNHSDRPKFYAADTWKVTQNLTLNGALGYEWETGKWYDLPFPAFLSPIIGNNLQAPPVSYTQFAPQIGFTYALGKDKKTVIRGGGGLFWDSEPLWHHQNAAALLEPPGNGRTTLTAGSLTNIFPNIVNLSTGTPVKVGDPLPLNTLTNMTLAQYIQIYHEQLPAITAQLAPTTPQSSGPYSVTGLDIAKAGIELHGPNFKNLKSYQTSIGIQRELGRDMVLQVDWARRQFENVDMGELDLNRSARYINGAPAPVIPTCTAAERFVPGQECSTGSITFWVPEGRSVYDGLLVKFQKRMSRGFQYVVSYALQKELTVVAPTLNLNNYFSTYGPNLPRHNLNIAGLGNLPWGFKLSVNTSIISRTPVMPTIAGYDLNGAGSTTLPLALAVPGLGYNCFNAGCGKSDLTKAVAAFNSTLVGTKDARGTLIKPISLPSDYQFGDPTLDTDVRLTKEFAYRERYRLSLFGEAFNAFNIANLTGYSYVIGPSFGQPTARFNQVFGSGGPRALQVGGRITF